MVLVLTACFVPSCWLSLEGGLLYAFVGPAAAVVLVPTYPSPLLPSPPSTAGPLGPYLPLRWPVGTWSPAVAALTPLQSLSVVPCDPLISMSMAFLGTGH